MTSDPSNDPSSKPGSEPGSERGGEQGKAPDRKVVRPPGALPAADPSSGPASADRLTALAHDLRNMIDGSMRWLGLAMAAIPGDGDRGHGRDQESDPDAQLGAAREQIETVRTTLERMGTMVNAAMRSGSVPIGSPLLGVDPCVSVGLAVDHAIDAATPLALAAGVRIEARIAHDAGGLPAGPLYTVVLNGLFNAVRACELAQRELGAPGEGRVEIVTRIDTARDELFIEILDDGTGLDPDLEREALFEPGITTDGEHAGLGLAMARQIVEGLEGIIDLSDRDDGTRGAVLRVRVPIPHGDEGDREIG